MVVDCETWCSSPSHLFVVWGRSLESGSTPFYYVYERFTDGEHGYESINRDLKTKPTYECRCDERLKPTGFVYYESMKREIERRLIYEYRCDERLKTKIEKSTLLTDTGLVVELELGRS